MLRIGSYEVAPEMGKTTPTYGVVSVQAHPGRTTLELEEGGSNPKAPGGRSRARWPWLDEAKTNQS